jgi:ribosomal protein S18 acetylase RimI-like enzyme
MNFIDMAMIKYRKAVAADFELIFQIKVNSIKPYVDEIWGWENNVQLEYHRKDFYPENILIVSDFNDNEVGFVDTVEYEESIFIKSILIHHSAQGNGLGTKIITDLIQESSVKNKPIALKVFKINKRARKLYEKLGFKIVGQTTFHHQMLCV